MVIDRQWLRPYHYFTSNTSYSNCMLPVHCPQMVMPLRQTYDHISYSNQCNCEPIHGNVIRLHISHHYMVRMLCCDIELPNHRPGHLVKSVKYLNKGRVYRTYALTSPRLILCTHNSAWRFLSLKLSYKGARLEGPPM